jgi:hypothetical protein
MARSWKRPITKVLGFLLATGVVSVTTPCDCRDLAQAGVISSQCDGFGGGCCGRQGVMTHPDIGQSAVVAPSPVLRYSPVIVMFSGFIPRASYPMSGIQSAFDPSPPLSPPSFTAVLRI